MFGIMIVHKPLGWTSYDVVRKVKGWVGEKKVGHGGTLDPLAEGVLVLGIGSKGTKQLSLVLKHTIKTYYAVIELGAVSSTDDKEGKIIKTSVGATHARPNVPVRYGRELPLRREDIEDCLKKFTGEFLQTPPAYSAVKIQGISAYKRARRGEQIVLEPKRVFVKEIKLLEYSYPHIKIELSCGSGFYVRALARDVGEALAVGGYLKELKRTRICDPENSEIDFRVENAITIQDIENNFIEMCIEVAGVVQGVGFRMFTQKIAQSLKLKGLVRNCSDGSVEIVCQGPVKLLDNFLAKIGKGPVFARIDELRAWYKAPTVLAIEGFMIV